jgi:hypothetical protein
MIVEAYDGSQSRQVLTGMITSTRVLNRVAPRWTKEGLLASRWENQIAQWCVDYHKRYKKAPGRHIEGIFSTWAESSGDKENAKSVGKFLQELSGRYNTLKKKTNPDFVIDQAGELFNRVALKRLRDQIDGALDTGKVDTGVKLANKFRKVEVGRQGLVKLTDKGLWENVFSTPPEPIVKYPGDLGKFFGRALRRDRFVVFMGPMKRGKSWWNFDLAWRGMEQGNRVLYFQLGDLSEDEEMERVACRLSGLPVFGGEYRIPKGLELSGNVPKVTFKKKASKSALTPKDIRGAIKRLQDTKAKLDTRRVNVDLMQWSFHPAKSFGLDGVRSVVEESVAEGWHPDIIAFDYMDIMAAPGGFHEDHRAAVNENWIGARRLSQELRCLVSSATQANAASFKADSMRMEHFAEDNRKFAHVTGMIGINQKPDEKEDEVYRLNWIVLRGEKFVVTRQCFTAGCLSIGNPAIKSKMPSWKKDNVDESGEE